MKLIRSEEEALEGTPWCVVDRENKEWAHTECGITYCKRFCQTIKPSYINLTSKRVCKDCAKVIEEEQKGRC